MERPRYLTRAVAQDALQDGKMAFVTGPRQVGKTTMARSLLSAPQNYRSWDDDEFRRAWVRSPRGALADRGSGVVVLDEIHKDRRWKTRIKGLYDSGDLAEGAVVTGSARLEHFRRGGDSLLGRYLPYRLHPFSVGESSVAPSPDELPALVRDPTWPFDAVLHLGGFPEPLLAGSEARALRWSRLRAERLLGEDVRDLRAVADLQRLRVLADLLPLRVGSLLSLNALREDVGVAHGTVAAWVAAFEALHHSFLVRPHARRVARAVRAAPKLYLFDTLRLPRAAVAARLENTTALHLLKACHFWTDTAAGDFELRFVRDKDGREIDFLILRDGAPWVAVECKTDDTDPSPALVRLASALAVPHRFQLVHRPTYDRTYPASGVRVVSYERFLAALP